MQSLKYQIKIFNICLPLGADIMSFEIPCPKGSIAIKSKKGF